MYQFPECDSDEDEDFKQQDRELKVSQQRLGGPQRPLNTGSRGGLGPWSDLGPLEPQENPSWGQVATGPGPGWALHPTNRRHGLRSGEGGGGLPRGEGTSDWAQPSRSPPCKRHQLWLHLATERPEVGTKGSLWGEVVVGDTGEADQVQCAQAPLALHLTPMLTGHEPLHLPPPPFQESAPFAVIGSNTVVEAKGQRVRGRLYPWGIVEGESRPGAQP